MKISEAALPVDATATVTVTVTVYAITAARPQIAAAAGITNINSNIINTNKNHTRVTNGAKIRASFYETYRGTLTEEDQDDYLDEQSAIRRSLKDGSQGGEGGGRSSSLRQHIAQGNGNANNGHHHQQQRRPSSEMSQNSNKTELENWIERKGKSQSKPHEDDYDNVTTISNASKNPYCVLGISQSASPKEIYTSYKHRMRETERRGGSDKAFVDVGNAYRRIKADMKRQEARKERRSSNKKSKRNKQHHQSPESDEESDAVSRRENIESRWKDHSQLVHQLFDNDNSKKSSKRNISSNSSVSSRGQVTTLLNSVQSQSEALAEMNLVPIEAGAANINEQNQTIQNSCFYLSLAASYLSGVGAFAEDPTAVYYLNTRNSNQSVATVEMEIATLPSNEKQLTMNLALQLKRAIEAVVLLVHPDWAKSGVGRPAWTVGLFSFLEERNLPFSFFSGFCPISETGPW
ncbi:hypothetical protein ACHAXR_003414 [Thalassiosira sp. AJA248-18]